MFRKNLWLVMLTAVSCLGVLSLPESSQKLTWMTAEVEATELTELEIVARLQQAPGNSTVTPDGRIIVSMHQFFNPTYKVMELKADGTLIPFPNPQWSQTELDTVLGIQADAQGIVWMLDNGMTGGVTPKLVGWNTKTNQLERVIYLPAPITEAKSFVNDLAVDLSNQAIYIADTATGDVPALIVVDLHTGLARRVLAGHQSTLAEDTDIVIDGQPVTIKQPDGTEIRPRIGVNPIALDAENQWLYYGPMNGTRMYRIKTADLLDVNLSDEQLGERVEDYGPRPNCDGIAIDQEGNIYITDINNNAIGVLKNDRTYQQLFSESWLSWPDAFSFSPDGYMYVVVNQLQRAAAFNQGQDLSQPPFLIVRFRPLAPGVVGR